MSGLQKWLEKWLMPIARVLEKQKHLQAVKDGIVGIVPIIIIGSFCLVPTGIGNLVGGGLMEWVNAHNNILTFPTYFTTNVMSLYAALYIANSLAKRYKLKNSCFCNSGPSAVICNCYRGWNMDGDIFGGRGLIYCYYFCDFCCRDYSIL